MVRVATVPKAAEGESMADNFSATEIARASTISEQNIIIAAAYDALVAARTQLGSFQTVDAAIERIENWRQKRDPKEPKR